MCISLIRRSSQLVGENITTEELPVYHKVFDELDGQLRKNAAIVSQSIYSENMLTEQRFLTGNSDSLF